MGALFKDVASNRRRLVCHVTVKLARKQHLLANVFLSAAMKLLAGGTAHVAKHIARDDYEGFGEGLCAEDARASAFRQPQLMTRIKPLANNPIKSSKKDLGPSSPTNVAWAWVESPGSSDSIKSTMPLRA